MIYFDTATIAKCYLNEPGSGAVRALASGSPAVATCDLTRAELVAVFHRHLREGQLDERAYATVFEQFRADTDAGVWHWLPLDVRLWEEVERQFYVLPATFFLRGGDAVHLACARIHGITEVYTNDRHMLAACEAFDLKGCEAIP